MSESKVRCPKCLGQHEPVQFGSFTAIPCPEMLQGEMAIVGGRDFGKANLIKYLREGEPKYEIKAVGDLKGTQAAYVGIVHGWQEWFRKGE